MREILFRGKRKYDKHWIYGCVNEDGRGTTIKFIENNFYKEVPVDPETVGQYTGLVDKNDKRIFEGDIFECYVDYDDSFGYSQTSSFLAVVVWDEKHFCYGMKVDDEIQNFSDWTWENSFLIGNIHDNPELLEVHVSDR